MAEDFTKLSAQVDRAVSLINEAITILQNPATSNDNQAVIDALTLRLQGAADALGAAEPAATPAPAAAPVDTTTAPTADTTAEPSADTSAPAA